MLKAVIFDLDGLLVDTERISYEIYRNMLKGFGYSFSLEEYVSGCSGRTGVGNMKDLISRYHLPYTLEEGLAFSDREEQRLVKEEGAPLKKGAKELLDFLEENRISIALASSSAKERTVSILKDDGVLDSFDLLVTSKDISKGKPDPQVYEVTLAKLGFSKEECIVLEDSEAGIAAAHAAGIPVIHIPDMKTAAQQYLSMTAAVFSSLDAVIPWIKDTYGIRKMKMPAYAGNFHCLAGSCPDSCCKEWEIVIDLETEEKYLNMKDAVGEELRSCMKKDEDGDTIFINKDNHCPWWNEEGLCRLRILKGQEMTSLICRQHPLIIEEYESFTEGMLSISCPEAFHLILSTPVKNTYPVITEQAEDEVLNLLVHARNQWLAEMREEDSAENNLRLLYSIAEETQEKINASEDIVEPMPHYDDLLHGIELCNAVFPAMKKEMEVTTQRFSKILQSVRNPFTSGDLHNSLSNQILAYLVCRYELKAVNDCDLMHHIQYIELNLILPAVLSSITHTDPEEMYRLFSREIEHNTDNSSLIYEMIASL